MRARYDDVAEAEHLESTDPVPSKRDAFVVPPWPGGRMAEWAYFAGNSLGLQPRTARAAIERELGEWG
ncbi:MAG: hypothetical protein FJW96_16230, partial [Actinobacteria bacterium]|nr:hypothetical protein [Actinomycetota bacterium]